MDDVRAVMDAAGSERAAVFGTSEGGNMSVLFAATYPARTLGSARSAASRGGSGARTTPGRRRRRKAAVLRPGRARLGGGPRRRGHRTEHRSRPPGSARDLPPPLRQPRRRPGAAEMNTQIDVREVLPRSTCRPWSCTGDRDVTVEEGGTWPSASPTPGSSSSPARPPVWTEGADESWTRSRSS